MQIKKFLFIYLLLQKTTTSHTKIPQNLINVIFNNVQAYFSLYGSTSIASSTLYYCITVLPLLKSNPTPNIISTAC